MHEKSSLHKNAAVIFGSILIFIGAAFNQWTLAMLFSPDGVLSLKNRIIIWDFNLASISIGFLTVIGRRFWEAEQFGNYLVIFSSAFSVLILEIFSAPCFWILILWFFVIIYHAVSTSKRAMTAIWINLSFIILTVGFFEGYLYVQKDKVRFEDIYTSKYATSHSVLGNEPLKNAKVVSGRKYYKNKLLYEVSYTINENGIRLCPPTNGQSKGECVIFFGGSFTYGEGVNDNETIPYLVGTKSNGKYRTYNFGFHGYGPHQMLAAIEYNYIENRLDCKPKHAIYLALRDHISRVAGLVSYNKNSRRYILNKDGNLVSTGSFRDFEKQWERNHIILSIIKDELMKSEILKKIFFSRRQIERSDINLFLEVVDKARKEFCGRYAGSKFYVIFWDDDGHKIDREINKTVLKGFRDKGISVYLISKILNDYNDKKLEYSISEYDHHPNKIAYQLIADYVVTTIFGQK